MLVQYFGLRFDAGMRSSKYMPRCIILVLHLGTKSLTSLTSTGNAMVQRGNVGSMSVSVVADEDTRQSTSCDYKDMISASYHYRTKQNLPNVDIWSAIDLIQPLTTLLELNLI